MQQRVTVVTVDKGMHTASRRRMLMDVFVLVRCVQGRQNDVNREFRIARDQGKLIVSPHWLTAVRIVYLIFLPPPSNIYLAPIQARLSPNLVSHTLVHRGRGD